MVDKNPIQLAGDVARCVELESVALRSWNASYLNDDPSPPEPQPLSVEPQYKASFVVSREKRCIDLLMKMLVVARESNGGPERIRVSCDISLRYSFEELPEELEGAPLKHFSELNGLVNAFPYFREMVQSATSRMGLAPLVLPLLKITGRPPHKKAAK